MADDENECSQRGALELDPNPEGDDLKGSGDEEEIDGDASDDSFVMVNDHGDPSYGGLDPEENPDPAAAEPNAGETGGFQGNAGPVTVTVVSGGDGGLSLQNEDDNAEGIVLIGSSGIVLRTESDLDREKVGKGELGLKDGNGESSDADASIGECCEEKGGGESCRDEEKREVEGTLEHHQEESASAVDVGEKLGSETVIAEANQEPEFESAVKVEENQDPVSVIVQHSETVIAEANQEPEFELAVKVEENQDPVPVIVQHSEFEAKHQEEPESMVEEKQEVELESAPEAEEEQKSESVVMETDHQREPESAVPEKQEPQSPVAEAGQLAEAPNTEMVVTETDQQREPEPSVDVEGNQEVGILAIKTDNLDDPESAVKVEEHQSWADVIEMDAQGESEIVETGEKQEARVIVTKADERAEPESAKMEEQQTCTDRVAHDQEGSDSIVHVEEKPDIEIPVRDSNSHEEFKSFVEVEARQLPEVAFKEIVGQEELKSAVEVETEKQPETVVSATKVVTEADERAEPESAKLEEQQTCTDRGTHDQEGSDSVVHIEEKLEIEIPVRDSNSREEFKSFVEVEARQLPEVAFKEIVGQEELNSAVEVETEKQPVTVVSAAQVILVEGNQEPETGLVSEVKSETILERDHENRSPEIAEAISICNVDGMRSTSDSLEDGDSERTNHVDMQLGGEATICPLESSNSPRVHHVDDKEIVNETAVRRGIELANDTKHECDVCESTSDSKKDIVVGHDGEMKLVQSATDTDCMATSVEGEQYVQKDDGKVSTPEEIESSDSIQTPRDEPAGPALDGERLGTHVVKRHHCYIIRIPRFSGGDELRTELQCARLRLDEKTQSRDSVRVEIQKKKATLNGFREKVEAAKGEEKAARAAVSAKRQEIDSVQSMINKMKNASSIDEINNNINKMEHTRQHETITLTLEKQYLREVKQLRHLREQLLANMGPQAEIQEALDRRDQIEGQFKTLKKELDSLRTVVLRAESDVKAARKKCDDEFQLLRDLQDQFRVVDNQRQEAYAHMLNLRNESIEKIKYFNMYRDDQRTAVNYVSAGDKEGLRSHCSKQVEKIMELWNKDDEFRKQYVESNVNSTLRRLRTLDGRSLGPDEVPPILRNNDTKSLSVAPLPIPLDLELKKERSAAMSAPEQVSQTDQSSKSRKPATSKDIVKAAVSDNEEAEREITRTKEEVELVRKAEELARKEEDLRKERVAAELKEQHRLEQRAKAKEAEERKKRKAEKDQAKAEHRAQKEAELREKRRAKKEEKKTEPTDTTDGAGGSNAPAVNIASPETAKEPETVARAAPRRSSRAPAVAKQYSKMEPLPLPLRNKGRRKMQTWMWALLTTLLVFILFLAGNYASFPHLNLPNFGF